MADTPAEEYLPPELGERCQRELEPQREQEQDHADFRKQLIARNEVPERIVYRSAH